MLAKVVLENREYYSHIFAKFNPGWNERVIVFDGENRKFELINVYNTKPSLKRKVFIIDTDTTGMVEKEEIKLSVATTFKDCIGYDWVLEDHNFIKQIKAGKPVSGEYVKIAKGQNDDIDTSEWKYVKNQKDADDLLSAAWGFHDAVIKDIRYQMKERFDDPSYVRVFFAGCWDCDIVLEFKKDILVHFNIDDNNIPDLFEANILFHDGFVYWVDDSVDDVGKISEEHIYFRARSLAWKMITKET